MVQNHALQLVCAIGMEPPINSHADAIRDEKLKVLRSLARWTPESLHLHAVRGQYTAGSVDGEKVVGYRDEPGVPSDSRTETFVALRTEIANWRWAGVPIYIRTGKRLALQDAQIEVNFRPAPHAIYKVMGSGANKLVIDLQPREGLELHLFAQPQSQRQKARGAQPPLVPVQLDLDFDKRFPGERIGAYERLLLDVIDGRLNLFVRADEQEEAWRWVEPLMESWAKRQRPALLRRWHLGPERVERDDCARRFLVERRTIRANTNTDSRTQKKYKNYAEDAEDAEDAEKKKSF